MNPPLTTEPDVVSDIRLM